MEVDCKEKNKGGSFGERLRSVRKAAGLSQTELAKKIGFRKAEVVSRFELGERTPKMKTLFSLTELLNIDLHWLITGEVSPTAKAVETVFKPYLVSHLADKTAHWQALIIERTRLTEKQKAGEDHKQRIAEINKEVESLGDYCEGLVLNIKATL